MREIKFRAWDFDEDLMLEDVSVENDTWDMLNEFLKHVREVIFMQYTGLKDKNGVGVYEGDILSQVSNDFLTPKQFVVTSIFDYHNMNALASVVEHVGVEVIGNIYEHSHLLEDKP